MIPTKLGEVLSWVAPKIESQVSGLNQLVLRNVFALHFAALLLERHMLQGMSMFNWKDNEGNYRCNLGRALGKGIFATTKNIQNWENVATGP